LASWRFEYGFSGLKHCSLPGGYGCRPFLAQILQGPDLMHVRRKMVLIVTASILLTAVPGAALIYSYAQRSILASEAAVLKKVTAGFAASAMQRFAQGKPKLAALAHLLEKELAPPVRPEEIAAFHKTMQRNADGVWRNRKPGYDGNSEAGIFLPPNTQENDTQKVLHLRIKHVMDSFGAAASKPLENVWYLSPHRSEIIFDRTFPEFAFDQQADNDYTGTPWVTYTSPRLNPKREFRFTPPLFDPVPRVWMVSALYPLYLKDQWIGSLGEDMQLTSVLETMFENGQIYDGVHHFLVDQQGNFVLAGPWQKQLESTPDAFRPNLSKESQLAAMLKSPLTDTPRMLSDKLMMHGKRYVAIGMRLEPLGWQYFRLTPVDAIMAPTRQLFVALVGMILLATALTGVMIGTVAGTSITRRIKMLSDAMKDYVNDHRRRVSTQLAGDDEITEVAHVFDDMADGIDRNIAERLKAESALRESEELWRFALEGSGDGVWDVNTQSGVAHYSTQWKRMLGYSDSEIGSRHEDLIKLIHPEDLPHVMAAVQDYSDGRQELYACEYRLRCKDGSHKWILARGMAVSRTAEGKPLRMIGTHTDITERKLTEEKLRTLFVAIEQSPTSIVITDLDANLQYVNPQFCRVTGYSPEEILGGNPRVLQSGLTPKETYQALWDTITAGKVWHGELVNRRKNGEIYWEEAHIAPVLNEHNVITQFVGVKFDITIRKKSEEAVRDSERKLTDILENVSAYIYLKDTEGRYLFANRPLRELFGAAMENIIGFGDEKFFDPETVANLRQNDRRVLVDGETIRAEETNTIPDTGKTATFWTVKLPLLREDGTIYALCGISTDITDRKQIEDALVEAKDLAEHAARVKSIFLANMSHEIRTPMNGIIGLTQLALNKPISPEVQDYLEKIRSSSDSLLGILNDILDYSRMEAGRMTIEHNPFVLDEVLNNLTNMFSIRAEEKQLHFAMDVAPDVPHDLIGDPLRIQQVLTNLLGNAVKFTERGKVLLKVALREERNSMARLEFSVQDTGIGIAPQDIAKLFQPFSQADGSITRRFGGSGLGLTISHNLLKLMGSELRVKSTPGKGSTFSFELVLGIGATSTRERERRHGQRMAGALSNGLRDHGHALTGTRIMVAEDNPINQQVVREFLQLSGVMVEVAENGREVLDLLEKQPFDAILMDAHMPVMGGVEATRRIRQQARFSGLPIIALTAGVTSEEREECLASGMNAFIAKPVNPDDLLVVLLQWVKPDSVAAANPVHSPPGTGAELGELAGFNLRNLLKLLGGNRHKARQLLLDFAGSMTTIPAEIRAEAVGGDPAKAHELAHKIKGAAGNIGAMDLYAAATRLDDGLKVGSFDQVAFDAFQVAFDRAMAAIAGLDTAGQATARSAAGDPEAFRIAALDLDRLLQENEFIPEEILRKIKAYLPSSMQKQFAMLRKQISDIQYQPARLTLRTITALPDIQEP